MKIFSTIIILLFSISLNAQQSIEPTLIDEYLNSTKQKSRKISEDIDKTTNKYLNKLDKLEKKILRKIKDSSINQNKFINKAKDLQDYNPDIDTINTVVQFFKNVNPELTINLLKEHSESFNSLTNSLQTSADVDGYISERIQYLKSLVNLNELDKGLLKEFKELNKIKFYYSQEIQEFKELLKDRQKVERKLLKVMAGDKVHFTVTSWWQSAATSTNSLSPVAPLVDLLMAAIPGGSGGKIVGDMLNSSMMTTPIKLYYG